MKTAIIDGDLYLYRLCIAAEREVCWDVERDIWMLWSDAGELKRSVSDWVETVKTRLEVVDVQFAFTSASNFRKTVSSTYKASRKGKRKPLAYSHLVMWVEREFTSWQLANIEADDVLGILGGSNSAKIMVSDDKDLKTVPGLHATLKDLEAYRITEEEANFALFSQAIQGDQSDGYPGVPGIGPKGVMRFLSEGMTEEELWTNTLAAFNSKGKSMKDAIQQVQLARILRPGEYDFDAKTAKLWTPPGVPISAVE